MSPDEERYYDDLRGALDRVLILLADGEFRIPSARAVFGLCHDLISMLLTRLPERTRP